MSFLKKKNNKNFEKSRTGFREQVEIWGSVLVILVCVAGYFLIVGPKSKRAEELEQQLAVVKDELQKKSEHLVWLESFDKSYKKIGASNRKFVEDFLPGGFDLPSWLINFSAIAEENNMSVEGLDYEINQPVAVTGQKVKSSEMNGIAGGEFVGWVDIKLSFAGSGYNNFKNFINDLDNNNRLIEIISFAYDPLATEHNIDLKVYYYINPNEINIDEE